MTCEQTLFYGRESFVETMGLCTASLLRPTPYRHEGPVKIEVLEMQAPVTARLTVPRKLFNQQRFLQCHQVSHTDP